MNADIATLSKFLLNVVSKALHYLIKIVCTLNILFCLCTWDPALEGFLCFIALKNNLSIFFLTEN
jgi:hypothetical protein